MKAISILAFLFLQANTALAAGAIAVGEPKDFTKQRLAIGVVQNASNREEAAKVALERCKETYGDENSRLATAQCVIKMVFVDRCYAIAVDERDSSPAWGWQVADALDVAEFAAIFKCVPPGQAKTHKCKIFVSGCDGEKAN